MNSTSQLIQKYQEQNIEITRNNIRLNERIAILENVIRELQQDNLQLRISNATKQNMKRKGITKKTISVKEKKKVKTKEEDKQQEQHDELTNNNKKRSCSSKPINYILPSTKCKLRKGDPFTFGNE